MSNSQSSFQCFLDLVLILEIDQLGNFKMECSSHSIGETIIKLKSYLLYM